MLKKSSYFGMDYEGELSPSETMKLLLQIEHLPNKKLGQNFLIDSNIVRKSLDFAELQSGDCVVEVGPGLGTLTGAMLKRGAKVYAVELDKTLFEFIKGAFKEARELSLINADAVEHPLAALPQDAQSYKIIANLPYAISTPWLDKVLSSKVLPQKMSLMLQKEAALRFSAKEGARDFCPISIFLSAAYDAKPMHKVSAACFYPKPNVDSALLPLCLKETPYIFADTSKALIRKIFCKKRKQILSIAKALEGLEREKTVKWLEDAQSKGLSPQSRPETIALNFWKALNEL